MAIKCIFAPNDGDGMDCKVLNAVCGGYNDHCKFRKTKAEFEAGMDESIRRCRALGRCDGCKYMDTPCSTSAELAAARASRSAMGAL